MTPERTRLLRIALILRYQARKSDAYTIWLRRVIGAESCESYAIWMRGEKQLTRKR